MGMGHAVVIGASMAGLAAAAELAGRFDAVTVLDRDVLTDDAAPRKGVPQAQHAHGLLEAGERAWNGWFPGFTEALVDAGALRVDASTAHAFLQGGFVMREGRPERPICMMSRPLLESVARARVGTLANVTTRAETSARALRCRDGRVTGVEIAGAGETETLDADLVVDCSGRGSVASKWLEALGYPAPPVSQVFVHTTYASRLFTRRDDDLDGSFIGIFETPPGRRGGALFPIEHDRWICALLGVNDEPVPRDDESYLAFADSLPTDVLSRVLRRQRAVSPIVLHRFPANQRRHFERVRRSPRSFVVLGDAMCSFNPIYGQGMSVAALQANELGRALDAHGPAGPAMPGAFYKACTPVVDVPWQFSVGGDFQWPGTTGERPRGVALSNRYAARVLRAAHRNASVADRFFLVQNLLAPPTTLAAPSVIWQAIRNGAAK